MHEGIRKRNRLPEWKGILIYIILLSAGMIYLNLIPASAAYAENLEYDSESNTAAGNNLSFENERVEAGVPLKVAGAPSDSVYQWTITNAYGAKTAFTTKENYYTPTENDLEKLISVSVEGVNQTGAAIYYSKLPVVYINNSTGYYGVGDGYSTAAMSVQGNKKYSDQQMLYDGNITIQLRGNSTKLRDKRPFSIRLDKKADLLGMGKSKHWVLLANDIDHTLMRNKLLYDFSGAIGMDTYMKSENVVLVFNHEYYGVYQLCEQVNINEESVDIYDWEESAEDAAKAITDSLIGSGKMKKDDLDLAISRLDEALCRNLSWITKPYSFSFDADMDGNKENYQISDYIDLPEATGGVLLEMDFFAFDGRHPSTMTTAYTQPLYFNTPEYAITNKPLFEYTQKYVQSFEYALHSTDFIYHENGTKYQFKNRYGGSSKPGYEESSFSAPEYDGKHYSELFDMDSLIQNFIVCEFSMNWDSMKNSMFFYKDIDGLFHVGPEWDFDWVWGNINMFGINTWYPKSWQTTENNFTVEQYYQTVQWNRSLIRDPYFLARVYEKYKEIRNTILEDIIKDGGTIDTYESELKEAAAANDAKWGYSYGAYHGAGFEKSIQNMKEFIHERLTWMDEQFTSLDTLVNSLGYYRPSPTLKVDQVDTKSSEGYTEITASVTDSDIAEVAFQMNGTHIYTAQVKDGRAVCRVPNGDLVQNTDLWNVVQILAKNSSGDYIIASQEAGNYYNAEANYTVFYTPEAALTVTSKPEEMDGNAALTQPAVGQGETWEDTGKDTQADIGNGAGDAKEVMAPAKDTKSIIIPVLTAVIIISLMTGAAILYILFNKKKDKKKN